MQSIETQAQRGIELLTLCQRLQSEKDGVDRPDPFVIDKTKILDEFARDIGQAATNMAAIQILVPMMLQLAELGRQLEANGRITVGYGEDYAQIALDFFTAEFGTVAQLKR